MLSVLSVGQPHALQPPFIQVCHLALFSFIAKTESLPILQNSTCHVTGMRGRPKKRGSSRA